MDSKANLIEAHKLQEVDNQLAKNVWLVKVPKYVAEKMKKANGVLGQISMIPSSKSGKTEILYSLDDRLKQPQESTPTTHKVIITPQYKQHLAVLGQTEAGRLSIDGKVIQRMECRPQADQNYLKYKKHQVEESNKPERYVIQIDNPVNTYKPVSTHAHIAEHEARKKADGKRSRDDAAHVKELLFKAFEKHQYYALKDLHALTKQPMPHLKEILKDICKYNLKAPHKNMYELKSEYRHYGEGSD
ncbi:general transcription factor IIF subunit 2-like [Watersipora subatra]|uniref:general transcription factor IIF subunit 2-like n=1 Tax=Watersipora subatra TaxID=2589382 RepID=UPI00355B7577